MSLEVRDARVKLGGRCVLDGFNVKVSPGEFIAVAGANGAGKSTALRLMAGLLAPEAGSVTLDGKAVADLDRRTLGRHIAYLPQDRTIHWSLTVERVVALGRLPHKGLPGGLSTRDAQSVFDAMARMDVSHLAHRPVAQLSGGERARVLLARALAQEAGYLLADEPAAGLDPAHVLSLFEDLQRLARSGKAVVAALHDLAFAARYATRVLLFKEGRCIADGPSDEVLSSANLAEAFGIDASVSHVEGLPVFLPRSSLRKTAEMT